MIDIMDEVNIDSAKTEGIEEAWLNLKALVEEMKGELDKLTQELYDSKYLAASWLELAKVVDRHRKDRMHSDMKLGWEMAKEILEQAKELGDE